MSKDHMNVGVIGCGMISGWYFKAASRFKQMRIIACGDLKKSNLRKNRAKPTRSR